MDVYIVWNQTYDYEDNVYMGNDNIVGVYVNKLTAYKTACTKQVYEHLNQCCGDKRNSCCDEEDEEMKKWLYDNPFPNEEEKNIEVWEKYFDIISDEEFVFKIRGDNFTSCYRRYNITKEHLNLE